MMMRLEACPLTAGIWTHEGYDISLRKYMYMYMYIYIIKVYMYMYIYVINIVGLLAVYDTFNLVVYTCSFLDRPLLMQLTDVL